MYDVIATALLKSSRRINILSMQLIKDVPYSIICKKNSK